MRLFITNAPVDWIVVLFGCLASTDIAGEKRLEDAHFDWMCSALLLALVSAFYGF